MTGRDLILYILANNLENEPVFKNGKFIGFMSANEVAAKLNVGPATVMTLVGIEQLEGYMIGNELFIRADKVEPKKEPCDA